MGINVYRRVNRISWYKEVFKIPPRKAHARIITSRASPEESEALDRLFNALNDIEARDRESDSEDLPPCIEKMASLEARINVIERRLGIFNR